MRFSWALDDAEIGESNVKSILLELFDIDSIYGGKNC
jgi:hypothetical protein